MPEMGKRWWNQGRKIKMKWPHGFVLFSQNIISYPRVGEGGSIVTNLETRHTWCKYLILWHHFFPKSGLTVSFPHSEICHLNSIVQFNKHQFSNNEGENWEAHGSSRHSSCHQELAHSPEHSGLFLQVFNLLSSFYHSRYHFQPLTCFAYEFLT